MFQSPTTLFPSFHHFWYKIFLPHVHRTGIGQITLQKNYTKQPCMTKYTEDKVTKLYTGKIGILNKMITKHKSKIKHQ